MDDGFCTEKSKGLSPGDILCSDNREAGCLLVPVFRPPVVAF